MPETPSWARIGWRNLSRNPRRSLITACGLAAGYFAVVFMVGWTGGITDELIENATSLVGGQIEIHDSAYRPERNLYDTLGGRNGIDVDRLLRALDAEPSVSAAAPRVRAGGLISSGESTLAGVLIGVDPERETSVSRFLHRLAGGRLPIAGRKELVIGEEMARQLAVAVGDELILVTHGADGSLANDLYTLAGIFRTGLVEIDRTTAVMTIRELQEFLVLDERRIHEVAVATADPKTADATAERLSGIIGGYDRPIAVASWTELNPVIVEYVALVEGSYWIILVVVFTIASFGIANTMLMATFERRREFAVMLALGATPRSILGVVVSEALAIGAVGLVLASVVVFPLMVWLHNDPPSLDWLYGNVSLGDVLLTPSLRVAYNATAWIWASVALLLTALIASLYPAFRAARIPPADTLSGL